VAGKLLESKLIGCVFKILFNEDWSPLVECTTDYNGEMVSVGL